MRCLGIAWVIYDVRRRLSIDGSAEQRGAIAAAGQPATDGTERWFVFGRTVQQAC